MCPAEKWLKPVACCGVRFNAKAFRCASKACPNGRETGFFRSIFVKAPSVCVHRTIHKEDASVPWMLIYSQILEASSIIFNSVEWKKVWESVSKSSSWMIQTPGVMYKTSYLKFTSSLCCCPPERWEKRLFLLFFIFISFVYLHRSILGLRGLGSIHQDNLRSQVTFRGAGLLFINCIFLD